MSLPGGPTASCQESSRRANSSSRTTSSLPRASWEDSSLAWPPPDLPASTLLTCETPVDTKTPSPAGRPFCFSRLDVLAENISALSSGRIWTKTINSTVTHAGCCMHASATCFKVFKATDLNAVALPHTTVKQSQLPQRRPLVCFFSERAEIKPW